MASSFSNFYITHPEDSNEMKQKLQAETGNKVKAMSRIMLYLSSLASGIRRASLTVLVGAVKATGTITFSGTGAANDTILINGVTFTAKNSGAGANEWNKGASAAASATALKNAINASVTALVSEHVVASDNGAGVVTITAKRAGSLGNAITIAEGVDGSSHMVESGARLTGGSDGTEKTYTFGNGAS